MFEFLFKYPADFFSNGRLILALPAWQLALAPLAVLALALLLLGYARIGRQIRGRQLLVTAVLRSLAISLVLFSLSRPLLEVTARVPQPGVVGVLLDNSISMRLDHGDDPRSAYIEQQFDTERGPLLRSLRENFDTRLFSFGASTRAIEDITDLDFSDGDSDLQQALQFVQAALQGEPLAGLVVVSDGAVQSSAQLEATLLAFKAAAIRVFGIGVGETQYQRDIEISRIEIPRQVLKGSRINARLSIRQQGYDGETLDLQVVDDSRILHRQRIRLAAGEQSFEIPLATDDAGARQLEFKLGALPGESITANNRRQATLSVDPRKTRILYFEGEPRFEFKFVRRAVADDEQIALAGLMRTADAKFYRVGIESEEELRNGFPITRDELFSYDALILGSVELALLSREQQDMIVEFVSRRGGGLLMLGGRHAFAEGGYHESVLRDLSPAVMAPRAQPGFSRDIRLQPTAAALVHPALLLAPSSDKSIARWLTLPPLTIVNPIQQIKPGATLLLASEAGDDEAAYVGMAFQRYGRGKVVAFPVQNSWLWQMHQDIELEDQTHELLWRQLLRWLAQGVPERLDLTLSSHGIHSGGSMVLRSEILQPDYSADNTAQARAVVTTPTGLEQVIDLARDTSLQGVYTAELTVTEPGNYQVRVELDQQGAMISSAESQFRVTPEGNEYYRSEMNPALLGQIAALTGGEFLPAGKTGGLAQALGQQRRGARSLTRHELWDMPVIFLLLILFLCAEWGYRRWRNLI